MSDLNPFVRSNAEYVRTLDVLGNASEDAAHYLHVKHGHSMDTCRAFIQKTIGEGGKLQVTHSSVRLTKRLPNGDRVKHSMHFDTLLKGVDKTNSIFSPNMVVYDAPEKNRSFLGEFIDNKMAARKVVKKRAAVAKNEGNKALATYCDNMQTTIKTLINSLSGAHASPHNPHYNKTAHSTLTSATRIATSYSNASSERLLSGNRHYWSAEITMNNLISVTRMTDYLELETVMNKYGLVIPTIEQLMEVIHRSSNMYWNDPHDMDKIEAFANKLDGLQRASFVYTADMYHIAKYNDKFARDLITTLIKRPTELVENPDEHLANCNDDIVALCGILCQDILAGKMVKDVKRDSPEDYRLYASTVAYVNSVMMEHADFIKVIMVTDNMPPSIYSFPTSIRRCVVGSDTDSTMFTCQDWVEWYCGKLDMGMEGQSVSAVFMYFNCSVIMHMLAMISRQMGVEEKNLFRMKMKNEYSFLVYMVANRSKHYITMINAKEGNIYKIPEIEIKGVALKDSKIPPRIMKTLEELIKQGMEDIMAGKNIDVYPIMQRIANIEHEIMESIKSGKIEYLSRAQVKTEAAYKNPMQANFAHYSAWRDVYSFKYGEVSKPPFGAVKISNTLDTPKKFTTWVESLDPEMMTRMKVWQQTNNKMYMGQFILPIDACLNGVPKEFIAATDIRGIVSELMQGYYIYLEILGMYMRNKATTRLLCDEIVLRPEIGSFLVE